MARFRGAVVVAVPMALAGALARAAEGDLDKAFNKTGKVILAAGDRGSVSARDLARQPDGKVLALAGIEGPGLEYTDVFLVRLLADGSPDRTFDGDGRAQTDIDDGVELPHALALQSDKRILVAGAREPPFLEITSNNTDFLFLRYTAGGKLDPSFGAGKGYVLMDSGGDDLIQGVAQQKDKKTVGVGYSFGADERYRLALVRLLANGQPDASFGPGGNGQVIMLIDGQEAIAYSVAVLGDGRILVAGEIVDSSSGDFLGLLVRFLPSGAVDTTFGDDGVVVLEEPGMASGVGKVLLEKGGKILLLGNLGSRTDFSKASVGVYRLDANGARDGSFGENGLVTIDFTSKVDLGGDMALGPGGKVIVVGAADVGFGRPTRVALARLLADGKPDPSFGKKGKKLFALDPDGSGGVGLALQKDSKILALSSLQGPAMAVTRHLAKPN